MKNKYRTGSLKDAEGLKNLAIKSWSPFSKVLSEDHWQSLKSNISSLATFRNLLNQSSCFVCESSDDEIIGMAFLVPSGNPTEIFDKDWACIRFVSVDPEFSGQGIGRKLTELCLNLAKQNKEQTIALHTSEIMNNARHLYESLGFEMLREIDPRLGKRYWLYTLELK